MQRQAGPSGVGVVAGLVCGIDNGRWSLYAGLASSGLLCEAPVDRLDDVDAFCARLRARGVQMVTPPTDHVDWGVRTAHVRDPDGHKIEATYWDMELARKLGMA